MSTIFKSLVNNTVGRIHNNPLTIGNTNLIVDNAVEAKIGSLIPPFRLTLWRNGLTPDSDSSVEIVEVTNKASVNNYTITRAQEGTSASSHAYNDYVGLLWTSGLAQQIETAVNNLETFRDVTYSTFINTTLPANIQNQAYTYAIDTGSVNTCVISVSPSIFGYTTGQGFSFKVLNTNTGSTTIDVNGMGPKTIHKNGTSILSPGDLVSGQMVYVEYDGVYFQLMNPVSNVVVPKFGGTGADGALNVLSGTTTINLGGASLVIKNYSYINISGGAVVNFTNPNAAGTVIVFRSQGNVTIAGNIYVTGCGSAGGAGSGAAGGYQFLNGADGIATLRLKYLKSSAAQAYNYVGGGPSRGAASSIDMTWDYLASGFPTEISQFYDFLLPGTGGSGGGSSGNGGGVGIGSTGGRGAGAFLIECSGSLNFTGNILANGINGVNGSGSTFGTGGGGGGGGGGSVIILYNTLISSSGTVLVNGGTVGSGFNNNPSGAGGAGIGGPGSNSYYAGGTGNGGAGKYLISLNIIRM